MKPPRWPLETINDLVTSLTPLSSMRPLHLHWHGSREPQRTSTMAAGRSPLGTDLEQRFSVGAKVNTCNHLHHWDCSCTSMFNLITLWRYQILRTCARAWATDINQIHPNVSALVRPFVRFRVGISGTSLCLPAPPSGWSAALCAPAQLAY